MRRVTIDYPETVLPNGKVLPPAPGMEIVVPDLPPPPAPPSHPCARYRSHLASGDPKREKTCLRCGRSMASKIPKMPPSTTDCIGREVALPARRDEGESEWPHGLV